MSTVYNILAKRYKAYLNILKDMQDNQWRSRKPFWDNLLELLKYTQAKGHSYIELDKLCEELCKFVNLLEMKIWKLKMKSDGCIIHISNGTEKFNVSS